MKISKTFLVGTSICFCIAGFTAATPAQKDEFKNLQVLPKNITAKELDRIMESYNEGLGVGCDYCHAKNATTKDIEFEKDTKPEKLVARKMMLMTNDLNHRYFTDSPGVQAVTCYTCHHGNPMPAVDTADFRKKSLY